MDMNFDISGLLTEEEAQELTNPTDGNLQPMPPKQDDGGEEENPDEREIDKADVLEEQERVGDEKDNEEREDARGDSHKGSSSPDVFYSSIARAVKNDGIFSNLSDEFIDKIKGPEDFGEAIEQEIAARLDERGKRINEMLGNGASQQEIQQSENMKSTLDYLNGLSPEQMETEGDEGDNLRKTILYNDFIARGFSKERALREIDKSFAAGTDVEDARDALESLTKYYQDSYDNIVKQQRKRHDDYVAKQKKQAEDYRKMVLEDDIAIGDQKLDKSVRQKIFDVTQKATYKDPDTGRLLTEMQRFQKEHPLEFLKQIGMWYVLTEGGKNLDGFVKDKVKSEKHKALRELESKIIANNNDGSLRYVGSGEDGDDDKNDPLLNPDWKIGFRE